MFQPKYTITDQIANQLSQIAEIKAMVSRSALLPAREAFLRKVAVIKMAHTSTSIEGNQLQEYQVKDLAEGKPVRAQADQVREVENYLSALRQIDILANTQKVFTMADILSVHKTVISDLVDPLKAGKFRPGSVYIVNVLPKGNEELAYTPPPADLVPRLIKNLLDWLDKNSQIHPIIRAGLFHYQFETIHPFTDGNGRTGRLMTLLHLYQSGWDFKKVLVLEDFYNINRKNYYLALQTGDSYKSRSEVDLTSWLEYYVTGFLHEVGRVRDQILNLSVIGNTSETENVLNNDELRLIDFVITVGRITSSDVVDILRVPKRTAQSKLKHLEDIKVLLKRDAGPSTYYVISPVEL